jgi:hypothetical protein
MSLPRPAIIQRLGGIASAQCGFPATLLRTVPSSVFQVSQQSEKFRLQQNEKFLLTTGKMAGWKRRSCCLRSEIEID